MRSDRQRGRLTVKPRFGIFTDFENLSRADFGIALKLKASLYLRMAIVLSAVEKPLPNFSGDEGRARKTKKPKPTDISPEPLISTEARTGIVCKPRLR